MNLTPQMAGQTRGPYAAAGGAAFGCGFSTGSHRLSSRGLESFQLEFELFDVAMELLRLAPEVHTPQLGDDQLQMLDLGIQTCHQRLHGRSIQHV